MAEKFVDPNPNSKILVYRESPYESILTSIISNVERGNLKFSKHLEKMQRELFYLEDAGYWNPHWNTQGMMARRNLVRQQIIERGDPELGIYEKVEEIGHWEGEKYISIKRRGGYQLGDVSLYEAVLAIASNIVLDDKEHARKVLNDIFRLYFDGNDIKYNKIDVAASIAKLADLLEHPKGKEIYEKVKSEVKSKKYESLSEWELEKTYPSLVYLFDNFGDQNQSNLIRDRITSLDLIKNKKVIHEPDENYSRYGPAHNIKLLRF